MFFPGPARDCARRVVILECPGRPSRIFRPCLSDARNQVGCQLLGVKEVEAVRAVQPCIALRELPHLLQGMLAADFGQGEALAVAVGDPPKPFQELHDVRMRLVVDMLLEVERPRALPAARRGRIVPKIRVVHREVDRVDAKPVDAPVQPEPSSAEQSVLHIAIVQIEVGLFFEEIVQVILAPPRVPGPGRSAEYGLPIIGRRPVRLCVGPDVPVGSRIIAI